VQYLAKLIRLYDITKDYFKGKSSIIVIGAFDGVHLGHKKIIKQCVKRAKEVKGISIVLTFENHPLNVIKGRMHKKLIISFEDKIKLIKSLGVDFIVSVKFDKNFSMLEPEQFCKGILTDRFHVREIFVGKGFRFGRDRKGNGIFLKNYFSPSGIKVNIVSLYKAGRVAASSTAVRKCFLEGDLEKVNLILGRCPYVAGTVSKALGRGRELGFPTANISVPKIFVIPKDGVYLGMVKISESSKKLPALVNIGDNPTFGNNKKWIEAFIINFNGNIYGKKIKIYFLKRLRDEVIFNSKDELVAQIKIDLENAVKYFKLNCEMQY
jgi:riboflavin kinase/FMN adenylyltransferase